MSKLYNVKKSKTRGLNTVDQDEAVMSRLIWTAVFANSAIVVFGALRVKSSA